MAYRPFVLAGAATVLGAMLVLLWPQHFGHAWLAALFFWSSVPVGSLGYLAMMRLIGGSWRKTFAPAMASGARSLVIPVIGTAPILVIMGSIYPWVHIVEPGFRGWWLSPIPFMLRSIL